MARYRLTPKRRQAILKAQKASARRRKRSGFLLKFGLNKTADLLTKGGAGKAQDFFAKNRKRAKRKRKQAKAGRKRRGY